MNRIVHPFLLLKIIPLVLIIALAIASASGCLPNDQKRQSDLQTLARWEDQRLAPHDSLTAMLQSEDAHIRLAAGRSAGLIGRTDITPIVIALAEDPSVTVRAQAIFSLGLLGDSRALPVVTEALKAVQPPVRMAALKALAHLENDGEALMNVAVTGPPEEAAKAWDALRNMVAGVDSTALVAAIKAGLLRPEKEVQWHVLRCSEVIPEASLLPNIIPFAHSSHVAVRVHAYRSLQKHQGLEPILAVMDGWQKQDGFKGRSLYRVQIAALRALGATGNSVWELDQTGEIQQDELAAILINGSGSPSAHVAETALEAMGRSVGELTLPAAAADRESLLPVWRIRMARAALGHVEQAHVGVRAEAVKAWALLRGAGSAGELVRILRQEESSHVLAAGLAAMGQVHPDPVLLLRQYAAGEFRENPGQAVSTSRKSATVRAAALEALAHVQLNRPEIILAGIPTDFIPSVIGAAATERDFVIAATACGLLGDFPTEETLDALVTSYMASSGEGAADVQRAALASMATIFTTIPADDRSLATISSALDSPDIRVRLAGRLTALASGHFQGQLLPSEASLRATIPAPAHPLAQPPVSLPFPSAKVKGTTQRGSFIISLDPDIAPNTCATFLDLISKGFYDDLTFHRVVPDFVAQAGCPRGDGWGGPGYSIRSEWSDHTYARGVVGIAHDGKDTGGSQFFVTLSPQPHLDGRYTIFGKVKSGMEIVDLLELGDHFSLEILP